MQPATYIPVEPILPLFRDAGMYLPIKPKANCANIPRRTAYQIEKIDRQADVQYDLFGMPKQDDNIVALVPRNGYRYLTYFVCDYFSGQKKAFEATKKLSRYNIDYMGDIVQLTEAELLSYPGIDETSVAEIKDGLAQIRMRLGSKPTRWVRPSFS